MYRPSGFGVKFANIIRQPRRANSKLCWRSVVLFRGMLLMSNALMLGPRRIRLSRFCRMVIWKRDFCLAVSSPMR